MSGKVIISLDTTQYKSPTQKDVDDAKAYVRRRNDSTILIESLILEKLRDAAKEITAICYKYNIEPENFVLNANENMYSQITAVMDRIDEEIMEMIEEYSSMAAESAEDKQEIIAYIHGLGRQNRNLQDTLDDYLWRYLYDLEALVASMKLAGVESGKAQTKIAAALLSVYTTPEVVRAMKAPGMKAVYLVSKGVHYDIGTQHPSVGLSNNGAKNVINMAKITVAMAWMRTQAIKFLEEGAVGYYQLRGSLYPCDSCDREVGFHLGLEGIMEKPLVHPHCCCYRVPIYAIEEAEQLTEELANY